MGMRIVIADLDGTLSDYGHRKHLYKERDYDAFNKAGKNDKPNDVPCDRLIMRPFDDNTSDDECKRKLFNEEINYSDVWFVLEDRKSVVDMWRGEGLTCLQVAPGDF